MHRLLEDLVVRVEQSNGDRPAALRALGDGAAALDAAEWIDARAQIVKRLKIKPAEVDALRADGRKAAKEAERAKAALTAAAADGRKAAKEAERAKAALTAAAAGETETAPGYVLSQGVAGTPFLAYRKMTTDGPMLQTLARFVPRVVGERFTHRADGGRVRLLRLELTTARGVVVVDVTPDDVADSRRFYAAIVAALGADAKLASSSAVKHLPLAAFDLADETRTREECYEFTGWIETGGRLRYLTAGGALGEPIVDLSGLALGAGVPALARFGPRDDGADALARGLAALVGPVRACFPDDVMLPGLAAAFLAPCLRWAPVVDRPALHYVGTTGVRKSALLGLLQAFYGPREPALTWRGTVNSLEIALSALRDALVTVDDLKASTSDKGAGVRLLQSYADRRGRTRATRDGGLTAARFVGGLLVSAGEDVPTGEASVAARSLFIPVEAGACRLDMLTQAQAAAGDLPTVTAHYIRWLIARHDQIEPHMAEYFGGARDHYRRELGRHKGINDAGRVVMTVALLETGAFLGASWLLAEGGWTESSMREWIADTRRALERLARTQAGAIGDESAARAFLSGLRALLDSRQLELYHHDSDAGLPSLAGCTPTAPGARFVGWHVVREGAIVLQPEIALGEVRSWLSRQGRTLPTERGLYAQLHDGSYLVREGNTTTTVVAKTGGRLQRVLWLRSDCLDDHEGA